MDLEQITKDFNDGKMISKCTWKLVLEAAGMMEDTLVDIQNADHKGLNGLVSSKCLGRVASL